MFDIIVAENAGFCMGVNNAFDKAIEIAKLYPNTAILGDIVHNRFAVEKIAESGLMVAENINDIGENSDIKNVIIHNVNLFTYTHSILSFEAASFKFSFNTLYSLVPSFGINKSTIFLQIGFLYTFSCHGFSVFFVFIFVEPLSFNFLVNV